MGVFVAMPTHRDLPPQTVASLLETQALLWRHGIGFGFEVQQGSSLVHQARIKSAWHFLQSDFTHLFWIDSDIVWKGEDFIRLLMFATKLECVGAIYPAKLDPPTLFMSLSDPDAEVEANELGCLPVKGMGLGFTCVQRKVMEQLAAKAPLCRFPHVDGPVPYLFRLDIVDGRLRGEDMAFFSDVAELGYQVWLDPNITLGHIGPKEYRADPRAFLVQS